MYVFDEPFWLIPFVYMLLIHLYSMSRPLMGAGHVALMIAMAGRYLLTPLSIYGTESLSKFATQYGYLNEAIILIIYEMIALFAYSTAVKAIFMLKKIWYTLCKGKQKLVL